MENKLRKALRNIIYDKKEKLEENLEIIKESLYERGYKKIKEIERDYEIKLNTALKESLNHKFLIESEDDEEDDDTKNNDDEEDDDAMDNDDKEKNNYFESNHDDVDDESIDDVYVNLSTDLGILIKEVIDEKYYNKVKKDFLTLKKHFKNDSLPENLNELALAFISCIDDSTLDVIEKYKVVNDNEEEEDNSENNEKINNFNNQEQNNNYLQDYNQFYNYYNFLRIENKKYENEFETDENDNYQDYIEVDYSNFEDEENIPLKSLFYKFYEFSNEKLKNVVYKNDSKTLKKYCIAMFIGLLSNFEFDNLEIDEKQRIVNLLEERITPRLLTVIRGMRAILLKGNRYE